MDFEPADTERLRVFFNVGKTGVPAVLRALKIRPIGRKVQWGVILSALGLSQHQDPEHWDDLISPLMHAKEVGAYCGVTSRTIYRWKKGEGLPEGIGPMPAAIDLSCGREDARKLRWRRSEIRAWQNRQPQPAYSRAAPVFGSLKPTK
jgi:predicted DNA-binding transcriptional regulator AlpA